MSSAKIVPQPVPLAEATEDKIREVLEEFNTAPEKDAVAVPKFLVVGCGGAGVQLASMMAKVFAANPHVRVVGVDQSLADLQYVNNIEKIALGEHGSGTFRKENAASSSTQVPTRVIAELGLSPDTIVCLLFSASGGSGSTIGPLMIDALSTNKIRTLGIVIADMSTAIYAINTLGTIKSIENKAISSNAYFPMALFDNTRSGQRAVNADVLTFTSFLIRLLTRPAVSIDRNDRLHWVDPKKTLGLPAGYYSIDITEEALGDLVVDSFPTLIDSSKQVDRFDSVLTLIPVGDDIEDHPSYKINTLSGKVGYLNSPDAVTNKSVIQGRIYKPTKAFTDFIAQLASLKRIEDAATHRIGEKHSLDTDDRIDDTGLVF